MSSRLRPTQIGWVQPDRAPSYLDPGSGGPENEFTNRNTTFMTWNLLHLARMIKDAGEFLDTVTSAQSGTPVVASITRILCTVRSGADDSLRLRFCLPSSWPVVLVDPSALHDEDDVPDARDVLDGVPRGGDDIGFHSGRQSTELFL